jgi:hypothetical protein
MKTTKDIKELNGRLRAIIQASDSLCDNDSMNLTFNTGNAGKEVFKAKCKTSEDGKYTTINITIKTNDEATKKYAQITYCHESNEYVYLIY